MIGKSDYSDYKKWFPKANHLTDHQETVGDDMTDLYIKDEHQMPYVGDLPPKDTYREGIYD